jgi:hypothetical protein
MRRGRWGKRDNTKAVPVLIAQYQPTKKLPERKDIMFILADGINTLLFYLLTDFLYVSL